jgi:hypothetical protein
MLDSALAACQAGIGPLVDEARRFFPTPKFLKPQLFSDAPKFAAEPIGSRVRMLLAKLLCGSFRPWGGFDQRDGERLGSNAPERVLQRGSLLVRQIE